MSMLPSFFIFQNTWNRNSANLYEINTQVSKYTHNLNVRDKVQNDKIIAGLQLQKEESFNSQITCHFLKYCHYITFLSLKYFL